MTIERTVASDRSRRVAQTRLFMGTTISIEIWRATDPAEARQAISRTFNWFRLVEATCSRFDPRTELYRLCESGRHEVPVSALLFRAVEFALGVAEATGGAFDPTVGDSMVRAGFGRHYLSGAEIAARGAGVVSYRDVELDAARQVVRLGAPLRLDLGAVAKGMAVDLASAELRGFPNHLVDAGGDLLVRGEPEEGEPWVVGVRDPRDVERVCLELRVRDVAVCTSGGYLRRRSAGGDGHHLLDPAGGASADGLASVTVVAEHAMLADALATAAFVLGPDRALGFLERQGTEGVLLDHDLTGRTTSGMSRWLA